MPLDNASAAVIGAILGPTAGLIGTKMKAIAEKRDAKRKAKQLIKEATDLLEFADTLHKSAAAGGLVAKVPPRSLDNLENTVVNRITEAIAAVCPTGISARQNPTRTVLDRVLLMHRPFVWWGWAVHGLYYILVGMFLLVAALVVNDYRTNAGDRAVGLGIAIFLGILTVIVNVFGNVIGKRHYEQAKRAELGENTACTGASVAATKGG